MTLLHTFSVRLVAGVIALAALAVSAPSARAQPFGDLDVHLWGWLGYEYEVSDQYESYWDGQLQLDVSKSFGQRLAVTTDFNFIDANNRKFGQLEQAFATALIWEDAETLLTAGKFNASFGVEPRDFWNRSTGTTSLLFGAQPQDLIGIMVTQPIGQTGLKIRPFLVNGFEGHLDDAGPPSAGITVEYQPVHELSFAVTTWFGRGFIRNETASGTYVGSSYVDPWGPPPTVNPGNTTYSDAWSSSGYNSVAGGNWVGPDLQARRGGTLYFVDGKATWTPTADFTLAAEGLFAATAASDDNATWGGALLLANYDITDRWRIFGRWSFLNDAQGVVTGIAQRRHELSAGLGYEIMHDTEIRAEYRYDFSNTDGDASTISAHLSFGL